MAGLTSLGNDWDSIREGVVAQRSGICRIDEWAKIDGLNTNLGGPLRDFKVPSHYKRKSVRSMGRVAQLSTVASEQALSAAGLLGESVPAKLVSLTVRLQAVRPQLLSSAQ
jgi:3-oxoacyl-[acyl-carrier-protein] synthase II